MRFGPVFAGTLFLGVAACLVVLGVAFNSMYEPKPEFATACWVVAGIFAALGLLMFAFSKRISGDR